MNRQSSTISCVASVISLVSLVWPACAFAQTQALHGNPNEPLEKYDMPPAYIYRLESSPRMISVHDVFTSYQVNVDANGNNIVGDAANEPVFVVKQKTANEMAIGWRQFDTVLSNFRQGG